MGTICNDGYNIVGVFSVFLCLSISGNGRLIKTTANTSTADAMTLTNSIGLTPPMGWSSSGHSCNTNEDLVIQIANTLVFTGLANLGYKYIILDDCWGQPTRNSQHKLVENPSKFPSGMKVLANYVHALGLKLGIRSSAGNSTCSGTMPGSLGYEQIDANTFASWGVDYLKYDNCFNNGISPRAQYKTMSDALKQTGRPIFYSISEWGDTEPALWAREFGNSWRTTNDVFDQWDRMLCVVDMNAVYADYAKPGAWNDPDLLQVGNGGMKYDQYKGQFSLWAISKAPLFIGCDMLNLNFDILDVLTNAEVIAVNQDPLGIQAKNVRNYGQRDVWAGPLTQNRTVVVLVNKKKGDMVTTVYWSDIGIPNNKIVFARDLWLHQDLNGIFTGSLTVTVPSQSFRMFIITPLF
ncbi:hypothetical protein Droror1_Dr00017441 [Drosera rotundifolia]